MAICGGYCSLWLVVLLAYHGQEAAAWCLPNHRPPHVTPHHRASAAPASVLAAASPTTHTEAADEKASYVNHAEEDYLWKFTGRCLFRPALVRLDDETIPSNSDLFVLHLFGWTLGGTVVLEYDESPVGPYHEYVKLGGLAVQWHPVGGLMVGQYGSHLYVNEAHAQVLCESVWNLPAERAVIALQDPGDRIAIRQENGNRFVVTGWNGVRNVPGFDFSRVPLLWTPSIKAIWTRFWPPLLAKQRDDEPNALALHRLRLSGTARLGWSTAKRTDDGAIPLGFDLCVDRLLIEISKQLHQAQ